MKIGIIGHFGGDHKFTDGQTVKTKSLYQGLRNHGIKNIDYSDTFFITKKPLKFIISFLRVLSRCDTIIVLLSNRGRKVLFPLLSLLSKHKKVYHYAIGGQLADEVATDKFYKKQVQCFTKNWVESQLIVSKLVQQGITNVEYIPNFKCINILRKEDLKRQYFEPYRFCMFSRIVKEKGVEDAIAAVNEINNYFKRTIVKLDIYGPIDKKYEKRFFDILKDGNGSSDYCGVVSPEKSVDYLKEYYIMLFPTYWKGEGMPGTIIDALSAGLPVIARRWKYCDEMICDNVTGLVYDYDKPEKLIDKMLFAIKHKDVICRMKENCLNKAHEYSEKTVVKAIIKEIIKS